MKKNKKTADKLSKFAKSWFFFRLSLAILVVLLVVLLVAKPKQQNGDSKYCTKRVEKIYQADLVSSEVLSKTYDDCMHRHSNYNNPYH